MRVRRVNASWALALLLACAAACASAPRGARADVAAAGAPAGQAVAAAEAAAEGEAAYAEGELGVDDASAVDDDLESLGPAVVELTDASFEHATQAAGGQTAGVWFVEFYAPWCGHCKRLESTWERVAQEFRAEGSPVIMARVDAHNNAALKSRFKIKSLPTLLLFANRRVYSYKGVRGAAELREWALTGHKHATGYDVPPEPNALVVLATRLEKWAAPHVHDFQKFMRHAPWYVRILVNISPFIVLVLAVNVFAWLYKRHRMYGANSKSKKE